jgi:primosomal protein N''
MSVQELYGLLYETAKPELEKKVADKEAEIEAVLDGFAGLTSKMKDRVNIRLEALQAELDALRADLRDSRLSWEYFTDQLTARKEALDRATATLNQEGQARQKCEVLKTVVDKIVCHFRRVGKRAILDHIDVIPAEDAAVRPLTFPATSLLKDSCLGALA